MQEEISFGQWLRKQRRALDLSRKALANQVGCAEVTLRRIEAGTLKPSRELSSVLLEKLDIPKAEWPQWISFARGLSGFPTQSIPSSNKPLTNLPAPLTTFIGREKEQSDVIKLINKHRLVTLTGPGGVGKTRLATNVGEQILGDYQNGVWLVELAPILDSSLIPHTMALTLGLREDPNRRIVDLLCDYLSEKRMLILLDNCEHILDACAQLINIVLKVCPQLKILATSREPLNIIGEAIYRVPSLRLPNLQQVLDTFKKYESIRLFEERAQLVQFDFLLTMDNIVFVAEICQRLDGIPLAIELAAAKVATFSTEEIAKQLNESFNLLAQGSRIALPRHQTLRGSIEWSWNLLTGPERRLMRQLSVFAGGWTIEAAQSVCDGDVIFLLNSLVTKSLISMHQRTENNTRYVFHETIRQYVREQLAESGENEVVRGRHLDFFLALSVQFEREVHGPQMSNWLKSMDAEYDNLRQAINWAAESGQAPLGLRLGYALHYFWLSRGYWSVGREALERLLACPEAAERTIIRADALNLAGDLATQQGELKEARTLIEESRSIGLELGEEGKLSLGWSTMLLGQTWIDHDPARALQNLDQSITLLREAGETWRLAIAVLVRGGLAESQGDLLLARQLFSESRAILRSIRDKLTSVIPSGALGRIFYDLGDYAAATAHLHEALDLYRGIDDKEYIPGTLADLGSIALLQGNAAQAIEYFEESLAETRELMNKRDIANVLSKIGIALSYHGKVARATALLEEGLELSQSIGNTYLTAACLTGLANLQRQPRRATQMLTAAQAVFEQSAGFIDPLYRMEQTRAENKLLEVLGAQDFAKFSEEGRAMTVEQAVALALGPSE